MSIDDLVQKIEALDVALAKRDARIAELEARLGLSPIIRRVWAEKGTRPIAIEKRRYQWAYLYGFVHPESGKAEWLILPTVSQDRVLCKIQKRGFIVPIPQGYRTLVHRILQGKGVDYGCL